jgi:uncharacterized membrane protein
MVMNTLPYSIIKVNYITFLSPNFPQYSENPAINPMWTLKILLDEGHHNPEFWIASQSLAKTQFWFFDYSRLYSQQED